MSGQVVTTQTIERAIHSVRGHRVILDADLALIYGVETRVLVQSVRRNTKRFPADFMLLLTGTEVANLRSQSVISRRAHGGRRTMPYAFTEQGVAMLASVLNSPRAISVNIEVVRVFVRLRHAIAINAELALRLAAVEASISEHRTATGSKLAEHERHIRMVLQAIQRLMDSGDEPTESTPIGFEIKRRTQ
jgi:hypothetical protein